jgi:hypothetical protein
MDEDIMEIDQIEDGHVVLAIPALRLIVMGRTLDEARAWARSAIAYRGGLSGSQGAKPEPTRAAADHDRTTLRILDDLHWADDSTWEFVQYKTSSDHEAALLGPW